MKGTIMRTFLIQATNNSAIICFTESTLVTCFLDKNDYYNLGVFTEKHNHLFQFKLDEENALEQIKQFQQKMRVLHKYLSSQQNSHEPYVLDLTDFNLTDYDIKVK